MIGQKSEILAGMLVCLPRPAVGLNGVRVRNNAAIRQSMQVEATRRGKSRQGQHYCE